MSRENNPSTGIADIIDKTDNKTNASIDIKDVKKANDPDTGIADRNKVRLK